MDNQTLINRVLDLAERNGHSISEMERLCDQKRGTTMDVWKRGSKPNVYSVAAIATLYGVSVEYLIGADTQKKPPANKQEAMVMAIAQGLLDLSYEDLEDILQHVMTLKSQHGA